MERSRKLHPIGGVRSLFIASEATVALLACLTVAGDRVAQGRNTLQIGVSNGTVELICASSTYVMINGQAIINPNPGTELVVTKDLAPGITYTVATSEDGGCGVNIDPSNQDARRGAVLDLLKQLAPGVPSTEIDLPSN